jgi:hypothetical protein
MITCFCGLSLSLSREQWALRYQPFAIYSNLVVSGFDEAASNITIGARATPASLNCFAKLENPPPKLGSFIRKPESNQSNRRINRFIRSVRHHSTSTVYLPLTALNSALSILVAPTFRKTRFKDDQQPWQFRMKFPFDVNRNCLCFTNNLQYQ